MVDTETYIAFWDVIERILERVPDCYALIKLKREFTHVYREFPDRLKELLGEVRDEKCLCVFPRNDYEPDVVFFGHEKSAAFTKQTMKFPVPDLAVEVLSDTTEQRDRGVKFEDYEAHGVREYWIVDAEAESVEQYVLEEGVFRLLLKSGSGDIESRVVTGFRIPIRAIFDSATNLETLRRLLA